MENPLARKPCCRHLSGHAREGLTPTPLCNINGDALGPVKFRLSFCTCVPPFYEGNFVSLFFFAVHPVQAYEVPGFGAVSNTKQHRYAAVVGRTILAGCNGWTLKGHMSFNIEYLYHDISSMNTPLESLLRNH